MQHYKQKILIVDDTPAVIDVIKDALLTQNYQIAIATSGEKALEKIEQIAPDLILLDILMPGINGYQTCKKLKKNTATAHIPVIFVSALNETFNKVEAFAAGAVDYVTKPIQNDELLARVKNHLAIAMLTKQLEGMNQNLEKKVKERSAELEFTYRNLKIKNDELINLTKQLDESHQRYQMVIEGANVGTFDTNYKTNQTIRNQKAALIIGYKHDELEHDPGLWDKLVHPNDKHLLELNNLNQIYLTNKPFKIEYRIKHKNGQYIWISHKGKVTEFDNDNPVRVSGIYTDITQNKLNEIELKNSEERYKSLLTSTQLVAWELDLNTMMFTYISPQVEKLCGYKASQWQNFNFWVSIIHPDDKKHAIENCINKINNNANNTFEYRIITAKNQTLWIKNISNIVTDNNVAVKIRGYFIDITEQTLNKLELIKHKNKLTQMVNERTIKLEQTNTELLKTNLELQKTNATIFEQNNQLSKTLQALKDTQAQLIQSEKLASLGVLIAGIAHEINNPVNFISSGIEGIKTNIAVILDMANMYLEKLKNQPGLINYTEQTQYSKNAYDMLDKSVNAVQIGIDRTVKIIKSLNSYSRSDQGKTPNINIHELIDNTLIILYNQYKNRINIEKNYSQIPPVTANPGQLNQVFMNIFINAVHAIENQGTITIKTWLNNTKNNILISIKDTGAGIDQSIIGNIFDPFFTTKEVGKGTGLGLSITYNIIKEHNGAIDVKSSKGKGTEFIIMLPV